MAGANDGASALDEAGVHEIALGAQIAGAGVGTGTLKADALETAPRDGTSVAPLACVLEAGAHEAALGPPAVLTAGTQKACASNGAGGGAGALEAGVHEAALSDGTSVAPVACALDASVHEAGLGTPAVPTAGAQKACAGDGAGGGPVLHSRRAHTRRRRAMRPQ